MTTIAAVLLAVVLLLIIVLAWATESRPQRIRRWRRDGQTWQAIATRLGTSPSSARRWATAR